MESSYELDILPLLNLVSQHAESLMGRGQVADLRAWCEAVPPRLRMAQPELSMWLAWALVLGEQHRQAETHVRATERRLNALEAARRNRFAPSLDRALARSLNFDSMRGQLALIRAIAARRAGHVEQAQAQLERAAANLHDDIPVLRAVLDAERGVLAQTKRDWGEATRRLSASARRAKGARHALLEVVALGELANVNWLQGDVARAETLAQRAQRVARAHNPALTAFIRGDAGALAASSPLAALNRRERDVLVCLANGLRDDEVADELEIAVSTVRWHCRNLYRKLGVKSRQRAVALLHGLPNPQN